MGVGISRRSVWPTVEVSGVLQGVLLKNHGLIEHEFRRFEVMLEQILRFKIIIPEGFLEKNERFRLLYYESVISYLWNIPDAAMPLAVRCAEIALKQKHLDEGIKQITLVRNGKSKQIKVEEIGFFELLNTAQSRALLGSKTNLIRYFNGMRNDIHSDKVASEADALEVIRHISQMLNILYPYNDETIGVKIYCRRCRTTFESGTNFDSYYIGSFFSTNCPKGHYVFSTIFPYYNE